MGSGRCFAARWDAFHSNLAPGSCLLRVRRPSRRSATATGRQRSLPGNGWMRTILRVGLGVVSVLAGLFAASVYVLVRELQEEERSRKALKWTMGKDLYAILGVARDANEVGLLPSWDARRRRACSAGARPVTKVARRRPSRARTRSRRSSGTQCVPHFMLLRVCVPAGLTRPDAQDRNPDNKEAAEARFKEVSRVRSHPGACSTT